MATVEPSAAEDRQRIRAAVDGILRDVAELPDRTSPDDQPDMMLVTADELRSILLHHLGSR